MSRAPVAKPLASAPRWPGSERAAWRPSAIRPVGSGCDTQCNRVGTGPTSIAIKESGSASGDRRDSATARQSCRKKRARNLELLRFLHCGVRQDIVNARITLAAPSVTPEQQRELWQIVECREWFIKMLARGDEAEFEQIDRDLEATLRRQPAGRRRSFPAPSFATVGAPAPFNNMR